MSSISIVVYATSKTNVQYYALTFIPSIGPALSSLARYSELRALKKTVSNRKGFPPKLYFPTPDDLDKRRVQLQKWLSSLLPSQEQEMEAFMKSQRGKYEEEEIEPLTPHGHVHLYVSNSDRVRRYDPISKQWPSVVAFNLFHVRLDMDSHLYLMANLIWAPSFRGIQIYYPPWHKAITLPYPDNFLKSVAPQHGVSLDSQFVLYHHKQVIALDIPTYAWVTFPPAPSSVNTVRDSLWWPGLIAAGKHIHLIYPTEHFMFNTSTRLWKTLAPPPLAGTYYPGWVYAKKKIYMMVCSSHTTSESYYYDVRLDEWTQVAAFPALHNVPTVVNLAFDGNNSIYVRGANQIFCYDISENSWEERKDMALSDRSMAIFFSNQLEERDGEGGKDMALFKSRIEKLLVKSKLSGTGPWAELFSKSQISQVELDLMTTFESASNLERINIFKKMAVSDNVFRQLVEEEPSIEARERIEWQVFQALQEDPSLGITLTTICPEKFKKTERGQYTWTPPVSGNASPDDPSPRKTDRYSANGLRDDDDVMHASEDEIEMIRITSDKIMARLKDKNVKVPDEFICPITHNIIIEPVATTDGHAFERVAIVSWFARGNATSPITNQKLDFIHVIPNLPLRKLIRSFLESHQVIVG